MKIEEYDKIKKGDHVLDIKHNEIFVVYDITETVACVKDLNDTVHLGIYRNRPTDLIKWMVNQ